jgi:hypothetical protein
MELLMLQDPQILLTMIKQKATNLMSHMKANDIIRRDNE